MSLEHEIDYEALIDHSIRDFQPAKRLWPAGVRLVCWILLEAAILILAVWVRGSDNLRTLFHNSGQLLAAGLFISASIATAFLALKSAIPGREVTWQQLVMAIAIVAAAFTFEPPAGEPFPGLLAGIPILTLQLFGLAALPWSVLFWAVRRGVPLQPERTGAIVGLAAFSLALGILRIIHYADGLANQRIWLATCGILITALSALAGGLWLDWIDRWQLSASLDEVRASTRWFDARTVFPIAIAASIVALILVVQGVRHAFVPIPDFDLTIDNYERSLAAGFRSNVPSASIDAMLTAYVEHGMPAYMWDFGPEGFTLVGGRWQPLADGTPVTYTWFRGATGGVLCMIRETDTFNPPPGARKEYHNLLFYRYRGFSLCLINIGGYGNFISVIAAPIPMRQFVALVLRAVH
jgi:negative regulator of sigma F NrsF-like protein